LNRSLRKLARLVAVMVGKLFEETPGDPSIVGYEENNAGGRRFTSSPPSLRARSGKMLAIKDQASAPRLT
jgi:hypothetical protein